MLLLPFDPCLTAIRVTYKQHKPSETQLSIIADDDQENCLFSLQSVFCTSVCGDDGDPL